MKNIDVYTMDNCGYCNAAKDLLASKNLSYREINITDDDEARMKLVLRTNHRTLPQIFIDGNFIGGYAELKNYFSKTEE